MQCLGLTSDAKMGPDQNELAWTLMSEKSEEYYGEGLC